MSLYRADCFFSVTTILGGSVGFSVKVPGTYGGVQPNDPTAGRHFKYAEFWVNNASDGDKVTNLKLTDTDGKLSAPEQAVFPNYPDIVYFYDPSTSGSLNAGFLVPGSSGSPKKVEIFDTDGQPHVKMLPAELYLTGTFTSGALAIGRILYCNIVWGRWLPI